MSSSPPIALFMTTIASQPALRQRQEYILRILQVKKIPFTTYDLASDEDAKRLWRRKAPQDKQQLPGILVGMKYPGSFEEFEDAVEHDELDIFLRLKEKWDPAIDEDRPMPTVKPVGVPGAASPLQMTPDHLKSRMYPQGTAPLSSPLSKKTPVNKRTGELDMGDELSGFGLQGVKVTQDELLALMAELGLDKSESGESSTVGTGTTKPLKKLKPVKEPEEDTVKQETEIEDGMSKVNESTQVSLHEATTQAEGQEPEEIEVASKIVKVQTKSTADEQGTENIAVDSKNEVMA